MLLGSAKKTAPTPLGRLWMSACCSDKSHPTSYKESGFLSNLSDDIAATAAVITAAVRRFLVIIPAYHACSFNMLLTI